MSEKSTMNNTEGSRNLMEFTGLQGTGEVSYHSEQGQGLLDLFKLLEA